MVGSKAPRKPPAKELTQRSYTKVWAFVVQKCFGSVRWEEVRVLRYTEEDIKLVASEYQLAVFETGTYFKEMPIA